MSNLPQRSTAISRRAILASATAGLFSVRHGLFAADQTPGTRPEQPYKILGEPAYLHDKGIWELEIESPFQRGPNAVRVLVPDSYKKSVPHRVLYLLPVEEGLGQKW